MTMLDRMRRHKGWLKWSLGIVVVTFVLLYIPAFMGDRTPGGTSPSDAVATIDGHTVTVAAYQRLYQQRVQSLRANYGGAIDDKMLQQLGIGQNILYALIEEQAVIAEAERLGITVSDSELRERILRKPELQVNGEFIGDVAYQRLLQSQRPPIRIADFEDEVRHAIMSEKLLAATTGWVRVTDAELDAEYRKRNEKVKVDLAVFNAAQFQKGIQATDAEIAAQFSAHADTYRVQDKRRVKFLAIDADALRAKMTATPQEVQAKYESSKQMYSTPEQIRASHILFKTDGKNDDAQKKKAEDVLAKIKAGADFAALAKQYRGRVRQEQRRRPRLLWPGPDGQGVRGRRVRPQRRPGERSREITVRISHHQTHRQEGRRHRDARRSERAGRRSGPPGEGPGRGAEAGR